MSRFVHAEYSVASLGACIRTQAVRAGVPHVGSRLEDIVERLASDKREAEAKGWDEAVTWLLGFVDCDEQQIEKLMQMNPHREQKSGPAT